MFQNILKQLEKKYNVKTLISKSGILLWPFLRDKVYFEVLKNNLGYNAKKRTRDKKQLIINFFYGMLNVLKLSSYQYYCFQNTNKRILWNGKYFDPYFDAWADKIGQKKCVFIEFAADKYYKQKQVHSRNIISDLPFMFAASIFSLFVNPKIVNQGLIEEILRNYHFKIRYRKEIKKKMGAYYFYKFLFKLCKPKGIFILSSFSRIEIVMAAKKQGIPIFEAQHGYIGRSHPFYTTEVPFYESYPDYFFSFGTYEIENNENLIFQKDQILPIGSLELESKKYITIPDELSLLKKKYRIIFCLTMQAIREKELLTAILKYARENSDCLFIICPKNKSFSYDQYTRQANIIVLPKYTIYDVLKISDYNITIFSTTAVEGEYLGAKTIFYNADNFSRKYFEIEKMNAIVIDEGEHLKNTDLNNFRNVEKEPYFLDNYFMNVENTTLEV